MSESKEVVADTEKLPSKPLNLEEHELPTCSTEKIQKSKINFDNNHANDGIKDADVVNITTAEEYLLNKGILLLDYERQMFLDMVHADALLVAAK